MNWQEKWAQVVSVKTCNSKMLNAHLSFVWSDVHVDWFLVQGNIETDKRILVFVVLVVYFVYHPWNLKTTRWITPDHLHSSWAIQRGAWTLFSSVFSDMRRNSQWINPTEFANICPSKDCDFPNTMEFATQQTYLLKVARSLVDEVELSIWTPATLPVFHTGHEAGHPARQTRTEVHSYATTPQQHLSRVETSHQWV